MEPNDEYTTTPPIDLGVCLSLGLLLALRTPKPLSSAINLTHGALKGARVLRHLPHSPSSPETLLLASKALVHGYKFSKNLNLRRPKSLSTLYKHLKPYFGALDLAKCSKIPFCEGGYLGFGVISYGYRFSKGLVRVVEGIVGVELDAAVRSGFDVVGLVVKAVKVAREVERVVGAGEGRVGRVGFEEGLGCGEGGVCWSLEGRRIGGERFDLGGVWGTWEVEEVEVVGLDGLLCLALPLDDRLASSCNVITV